MPATRLMEPDVSDSGEQPSPPCGPSEARLSSSSRHQNSSRQRERCECVHDFPIRVWLPTRVRSAIAGRRTSATAVTAMTDPTLFGRLARYRCEGSVDARWRCWRGVSCTFTVEPLRFIRCTRLHSVSVDDKKPQRGNDSVLLGRQDPREHGRLFGRRTSAV